MNIKTCIVWRTILVKFLAWQCCACFEMVDLSKVFEGPLAKIIKYLDLGMVECVLVTILVGEVAERCVLQLIFPLNKFGP